MIGLNQFFNVGLIFLGNEASLHPKSVFSYFFAAFVGYSFVPVSLLGLVPLNADLSLSKLFICIQRIGGSSRVLYVTIETK